MTLKSNRLRLVCDAELSVGCVDTPAQNANASEVTPGLLSRSNPYPPVPMAVAIVVIVMGLTIMDSFVSVWLFDYVDYDLVFLAVLGKLFVLASVTAVISVINAFLGWLAEPDAGCEWARGRAKLVKR
jgi:hypothetical protein